MNTFRAQTICQIKENSAKIFSLEIDFFFNYPFSPLQNDWVGLGDFIFKAVF